MAVVDPQFQEHYRDWIGFTRLMKYGLVTVVVILVLLAIFLL
jgi:hypothetical protein